MRSTMPDRVQFHAHSHAPNRAAVLTTARRLDASSQYAGRGVTIAFLDSGFYRHPDLVEPANRIVALEDVAATRRSNGSSDTPEPWMWHGTQTAVVAAGNGRLSTGLYRGLAHEARLALIKVSENGRIPDGNIVRGLEWLVENRERYNIRVANLSLGGDVDLSFTDSEVDRAAEAAVRAGIVLVVAAGNAGCTEAHTSLPPANSPAVITVGGYDDKNQVDRERFDAYCSNYGLTIDGLLKPELVAPAIWVAAPILPGTGEHARAEALSEIAATPDAFLCDIPYETWQRAELWGGFCPDAVDTIRAEVDAKLREYKIVSAHYQHVDGTSFAAPIVSSVVAQMLEANPSLSPAAVKNILISTADRIPRIPAERQGYGRLNARRAVEVARSERHGAHGVQYRPPFCDASGLVFHFHDDAASHVSLAGDFNGWEVGRTVFERQATGVWRAEIATPDPGRYRYKIVVDGRRWVEDPNNGHKEPDAYGGYNAIVTVG